MKDVLKVLEHEELTSTQKLLMVAIVVLNESEAETISLTDLVYYTSFTKKAVINNLKMLEEKGVLVIVKDSTRGNKYQLNLK